MTEAEALRKQLVDDLRRRGVVRSEQVCEAFATVPRHIFVPEQPLPDVYADRALVTKQIDGIGVSSSSQPSIMAVMLEQLELKRGQRVLEIGAGTGYNAALLSQLVGSDGHVTTIDIDDETAKGAEEHLRSAGYEGVQVVTGDGGFAYGQNAPYDRIIATASCWQIPQPWLDQLVEGGVLVMPFRLNGVHVALALRKQGECLVSERTCECGFMPMRGEFGRLHAGRVGPDLGVWADCEVDESMKAAVARLLVQERHVRFRFPRRRDRRTGPLYYLALQGRPMLQLLRRPIGAESAFLMLVSPESAVALGWERPKRGNVPLFGTGEALDFLKDALERWRVEGRPDVRDLRVRVRPAAGEALGALPQAVDGRYVLRRGEHVYELWFER
ncbi:MAG: methyltransferase domain-containing protein [Dehalococcoidia bacterium]